VGVGLEGGEAALGREREGERGAREERGRIGISLRLFFLDFQ